MEEVSVFINAARIYIRMKMMEEAATTQVAWVLSYVQEGVAEAWKVSQTSFGHIFTNSSTILTVSKRA